MSESRKAKLVSFLPVIVLYLSGGGEERVAIWKSGSGLSVILVSA